MNIKGVKIFDPIRVKIRDILQEFSGEILKWTILFLDGVTNKGEGKTLLEFAKQVNTSKNGIAVTKEELFKISDRFFQIYEIVVIGNKDFCNSHRYNNENEMISKCSVVITLIDCACWEIYSKNSDIIQNIKDKFNNTEFI